MPVRATSGHADSTTAAAPARRRNDRRLSEPTSASCSGPLPMGQMNDNGQWRARQRSPRETKKILLIVHRDPERVVRCEARTPSTAGRRRRARPGRAGAASSVRRPRTIYLSRMRIVCLVPSATELLFALGLGDEVVAVTHECDYPPERCRAAPHHPRRAAAEGLSLGEIDARGARAHRGRARRSTGSTRTCCAELEPDLIVTQALCAVCAVSYDDVRAVAERIETEPKVISLDPHTLGEVHGRRAHARPGDRPQRRGRRRSSPARPARIDRVRLAVREARAGRASPRSSGSTRSSSPGTGRRSSSSYAGGDDVLGLAGEHSEQRSWEEVVAAEPDVVVAMPCGYDAARSLGGGADYRDELQQVGAREVVAVDAAAYFSRPGPRLVDGLEVLAHVAAPRPRAAGRERGAARCRSSL